MVDTSKRQIADVKAEIARYVAARYKAARQLQAIYRQAVKDVGEGSSTLSSCPNVILCADELTPAETVALDKSMGDLSFCNEARLAAIAHPFLRAGRAKLLRAGYAMENDAEGICPSISGVAHSLRRKSSSLPTKTRRARWRVSWLSSEHCTKGQTRKPMKGESCAGLAWML